ncbi:MAG: DUF3040 domain-containing protein [Thermocrispum sp.]
MLSYPEQEQFRQIESRLHKDDPEFGRTSLPGPQQTCRRRQQRSAKVSNVMFLLLSLFLLVNGALIGALVLLAVAAMFWGVSRYSDYTPTAERHDGGPSQG